MKKFQKKLNFDRVTKINDFFKTDVCSSITIIVYEKAKKASMAITF